MNRTNLLVKANTPEKAQQIFDEKIRQAWDLGFCQVGEAVSGWNGKTYVIATVIETHHFVERKGDEHKAGA